MLEKPQVSDEVILEKLQEAYSLQVKELSFLPLGADPNTAVYRITDFNNTTYFLKLRLGNFENFCVEFPGFLQEHGVPGIIAPILTGDGNPQVALGEFQLILFPFVDGQDAFEVELRDDDWITLGRIGRKVHGLHLPESLMRLIPVEDFSPCYRFALQWLMKSVSGGIYSDVLEERLATFLRIHESTVNWLLYQAEHLAGELKETSRDLVLCHADLHAGNVFIDRHDRSLYIIDWDDPVFAPKERDLMFPGGAQGFNGHTPEQEEELFMRGYGSVLVDNKALAYYRCERVIIDLALFGKVICNLEESRGNREKAFSYLASNFMRGGTIERAEATIKEI